MAVTGNYPTVRVVQSNNQKGAQNCSVEKRTKRGGRKLREIELLRGEKGTCSQGLIERGKRTRGLTRQKRGRSRLPISVKTSKRTRREAQDLPEMKRGVREKIIGRAEGIRPSNCTTGPTNRTYKKNVKMSTLRFQNILSGEAIRDLTRERTKKKGRTV